MTKSACTLRKSVVFCKLDLLLNHADLDVIYNAYNVLNEDILKLGATALNCQLEVRFQVSSFNKF